MGIQDISEEECTHSSNAISIGLSVLLKAVHGLEVTFVRKNMNRGDYDLVVTIQKYQWESWGRPNCLILDVKPRNVAERDKKPTDNWPTDDEEEDLEYWLDRHGSKALMERIIKLERKVRVLETDSEK